MSAEPSSNCLNDTGYKTGEDIRTQGVRTAAIIRQVAAAAIAIDNANQLVKNYRDQRDISKRALAIAQKQQEQLRTVYWPREEQFLNEFANPEAIETVEVMGRRYAGRLVATVSAAFARQLKEARCRFSRYCTSANKKVMQDLLLARAAGIANARVLGRNIAFAEYQVRDDTNFERRAQAVSIGRGLIQQAATLYANAGQGLASIGNLFAGQLSSALEAFGYARRDYSQAIGFNSTLAQGQYEYFRSQRAGTTMPNTGTSEWGAFAPNVGSYGYNSSTQSFMNLEASNVFTPFDSKALSSKDPNSVWNWWQNERQMNEADVGNRDKARFGKATFPVESITGGSVTVDMSQFPLYHVDEYAPGEKGPPYPM